MSRDFFDKNYGEREITPQFQSHLSSDDYFDEYEIENGSSPNEIKKSKFQKLRLWFNDLGRL